MKRRANKIIIQGLLALCMAVSMFFVTGKAEAADTTCTEHTKYAVKSFSGAEVANYRKTKPYQVPEVEKGYLFAGWYSDANCTKAVRDGNEIDSKATYYAKCVPEHVADVKAQLSLNLVQENGDQSTGKIRFLTTVDSLAYQQSGFYISYNGKTIKNTSNTVYKTIQATDMNGNTDTKNPHVFCGISEFFRACTIKNVTNKSYAVQFDVQAFWLTLDGTEVCGPEVSKQMQNGLIKDVKYVSSTTGSDENAGTIESPYATLEKAIENVAAYGKIVIKDSCNATVTDKTYTIPAATAGGEDSSETVQAVTITDNDSSKDKHITITGGTLGLRGASEIHLGDSIKFEEITLDFDENTSLYANGYTLEIAESSILSEYSDGTVHSKNLTVYGGSRNAEITGDTNLILRAGTYANIYGGGCVSDSKNTKLNGYVNGNTNIVIGGTVNKGKTYKSDHDINNGLNLFGGGATGRAAIRGNTNIMVESTDNNFRYIYGGSKGTHVTGTATVNFQNGTAMSLFGGGYYGVAQGDTYVTMTGGKVEQVFGGSQSLPANANTNVQILGGTVTRRIYGGCYNNRTLSGWSSQYSVTGNSSVSISPNATIKLSDSDATICAVSRYDKFFEEEKGVFIFHKDKTFSGNIGGFDNPGKNSHHYMVTTNGNAATDSLGTVSPQGKYIRIEPKSGYSATVYQGTDTTGTELHYTESESIYELPALSAATDSMSIYVEFTVKTDKINYVAKTGQAYYPTLEEAVDIAHKMYANREKKVEGDSVIVTLLSDVEVKATLNITDNANITLTNDAAPRTIYRGAELSEAQWIHVAKGAALQIKGVGETKGLTIDGRTRNEALAGKATSSSSGSLYELMTNAGTMILENTTFQNVYHNSSSALDTRREKGGVLYATGASDTMITNCAFHDNYTGESGTVLFVDGNSKVNIRSSQFEGNTAPNGNAGAIYEHMAALTATNCEFINNTSSKYGGGVMVNSSTARFDNCTFKDSKALASGAYGAAMYICGKSTATINDSMITGNSGSGNGGAISIYGTGTDATTVNVNNTEFSENTTSATWGGAIYVENATTNIDNTNFKSNKAGSNGGAIGMSKESVVIVSGGSFSGNNVGNKGGAICASYASATDDNVFDIQLTGATFDDNYSAKDGGAIFGGPGTKLAVDSCVFKNNYSIGKVSGAGGAIAVNGSEVENGFNASIEVKGATSFTSNKANSTQASSATAPAGYGGAIYVGYATANITGATFTGNNAVYGGAIGSNAKSGITVAQTDFIKNVVTGQGGAMRTCVKEAAPGTLIVEMTDCKFHGNGASSRGGAIGSDQGTKLIVQQCEFEGNKTTASATYDGGGAICVAGNDKLKSNETTIRSTTFKDNASKTRGGAIMLWHADLTVTDSDFLLNHAQNGVGGAIVAVGSGTVSISSTNGSKFKGNTATGNGQALNQANPVIMTVEGYIFDGNGAAPDTAEYHVVYFGTVTAGSTVKNCNFAAGQKINKDNWNTDTYGNNFNWTATE